LPIVLHVGIIRTKTPSRSRRSSWARCLLYEEHRSRISHRNCRQQGSSGIRRDSSNVSGFCISNSIKAEVREDNVGIAKRSIEAKGFRGAAVGEAHLRPVARPRGIRPLEGVPVTSRGQRTPAAFIQRSRTAGDDVSHRRKTANLDGTIAFFRCSSSEVPIRTIAQSEPSNHESTRLARHIGHPM
jgi:hypothetical protein